MTALLTVLVRRHPIKAALLAIGMLPRLIVFDRAPNPLLLRYLACGVGFIVFRRRGLAMDLE
jgi:hypothetical protein